MDFFSVALLLLVIFLFSFFSVKGMIRFGITLFLENKMKSVLSRFNFKHTALDITIALPLCLLVLGVFIGYGIQIQMLGLISVLLLLAFTLVGSYLLLSGRKEKIFSVFVCFLASLCISINAPLFEEMPSFLIYPLFGCLIYVFVFVFDVLNRSPWILCISLLGQAFFILFAGLFDVIPQDAVIMAFMLLTVFLSDILNHSAREGRVVLDGMSARLLGFFEGLVAVYFFANGFYAMPVIVSSPLFILFIEGGIASYMITRSLSGISFDQNLFSRAYSLAPQQKKLRNYMLFIMTLLSSLGVISMIQQGRLSQSCLVLSVLVVFDMLSRLKRWGVDAPSYKDVVSDLKTGFSVLFQEMKHLPLKSDKKDKAGKVKVPSVKIKQKRSNRKTGK